VLPYLDGAGEVVFSEFGLQTELKSSALEYFEELVRSDLYNNAAYVLKDTYIEHPYDKPKRLNVTFTCLLSIATSQLCKPLTKSKIISRDALYHHSCSWGGCYPNWRVCFSTLSWALPGGCCERILVQNDGNTDTSGNTKARRWLCFGTNIGVKGQNMSGSLSAIIKDSRSGTFYALSCYHVMKHPTESEIIHPGLNDYLSHLTWNLHEHSTWVKDTISRDQAITQKSSFAFEFLQDTAELSVKFKELNQIRDNHRDPDRETPKNVQLADYHKQCVQEGLVNNLGS